MRSNKVKKQISGLKELPSWIPSVLIPPAKAVFLIPCFFKKGEMRWQKR